MESESGTIALIVPARHVKTVKTALERAGKLDRTSKISNESPKAGQGTQKSENQEGLSVSNGSRVDTTQTTAASSAERYMRLPTTFVFSLDSDNGDLLTQNSQLNQLRFQVLQSLGLEALSIDVTLARSVSPDTNTATLEKNPLRRAFQEALKELSDSKLSALQLTIGTLISDLPESYSIYSPMLLLPHNCFSSPSWQSLLSKHPPESPELQPIWAHVASAFRVTHIAINSPIPLSTNANTTAPKYENILRSPVNITSLYNSFGPYPTPQTISSPTQADFDAGFWVSTTQNGIHQIWAPLYTMFSRGNIREKTRVLQLPSVTEAFDVPSAAVDLYAGIGYFAFSYKKGGARRSDPEPGIQTVICFELNPWSVEGLRRGAAKNGWTMRIFTEDDILSTSTDETPIDKVDFLIFQMSNERALEILLLPKFRHIGLPVRHVNLGLLPTSRLSWETAARLVDGQRGGWVHVHENVGAGEIDEKKKDIEREFRRLVEAREVRMATKVSVEHVERVKLYAPGVYHCVFDIHIEGMAKIK